MIRVKNNTIKYNYFIWWIWTRDFQNYNPSEIGNPALLWKAEVKPRQVNDITISCMHTEIDKKRKEQIFAISKDILVI